jgi:hypothetical protein
MCVCKVQMIILNAEPADFTGSLNSYLKFEAAGQI